MKSFAKVLGMVLAGIVILVIGALFFLTRMFDPNDYKDDIRQAAREQANVELTLDGDIGWSLFPWLGIELKDVGVAPVATPDQPLASVGTLGLGVKVLPLLRKQLRMSDVILNDIQLQLVRNDKGVGNWETVGPQAKPEKAEDGTPSGMDESPSDAGGTFDITVESVRVTNASVRYEDRQTGRTLSLDEANFTTGALVPDEPFDVAFQGLLTTDQPAMRVRVDLSSVATMQPEAQRYQLSAVDLKVDASGDPFGGRAVNFQLQGDGMVDLAEQVAELGQLRLSLADMRATGQLKVTGLSSEPQLSGRLDVAAFDARDLLRDIGQELPEMADPGALSSVALSANLKGGANSLMLNDLQLALDGFALNGSLGVADFERQALRFDLSGDTLNLDNYLPPREAGEADGSGAAGAGGSRSQSAPEEWSDDALLPLDLLARLDVDGKLALQQVTLTGQHIKPFSVAVRARDGLVRLTQFEGGIFAGSFSATGSIDTRKTPVSNTLKAQLKGIDSAAAQQAYEVPQQVRGLMDMNLEVAAGGNSLRRWMNSLNGSASFKVNDGALLGVNLEQQVCRAIALANRKSLSGEHGSENTPFEQLSGSFTIRNGVVSNRDLIADLPGLAGKGQGEINLPDQRIDYRLGLLLEGDRSEMPDEACQVNERYAGIEWPIRCQGYLHNAGSSCGVDTDGVGKIAAKLVGNEVQRKLEERIDDSLGDKAPELRDAIKGLFSR
ncbi:AsmA family protein [Halopseudomonas oceani]|uniref:AsmA family protein n=1 Tax=Halopseudomonas oceani TaxID=1708783 RepID=UPI002AA85ECE|nr:AsmA family protein [Halopseudomonas oceani]